jgi:hypothetical protein
MKGTLLLRPKQFFDPISPRIAARWLALTPYVVRPVQGWSKSGSNEGHFILKAKRVFRPYLASHCSRLTQTSQAALPASLPQPEQVWSKSKNNGGHFTLEVKTVFDLSRLGLRWGDWNNTRGTLYAYDKPVQFWSKSGRIEGNFTLQAQKVSRPYLASRCSRLTRTSHVTLTPSAPQRLEVWSKSSTNEMPIYSWGRNSFFVSIWPRIAAWWLKHTWHCLHMWHNQCKFRRNRAVKKDNLIIRPKDFLAISPPISAGWLKHHTWHTLFICHNQGKFGRNRRVKRALYSWDRNSSSPPYRFPLQRGDSNITLSNPSRGCTTSSRLFEIGL